MTLAIGAGKAVYPEYQPQPPQQQQQAPSVVVGPLGGSLGGPLGYLQQAPPYEHHHHHALHHPHPLAHPSGTPPPSSPSSTNTGALGAPGNCCCPTSSSSSSSSSSAASSRRGSRSSRSSRSGEDAGGNGDGSVAWYCCCCCTSPRARRSLLASVGVCVLVLVYTLLGAFAFMALEGSGLHNGSLLSSSLPPGPVTRASAPAHDELRTKTVEKLWSITEDLNILYKDNWTRLAAQEVLRFQDMLVENIKSGVALNGDAVMAASSSKDTKNGKDPPAKATTVTTAASTYQGTHPAHRWTFHSSFLYSLTLITTIGYGSVSPRTTWGRLVSISYAIVGIPLMLLYLSTTGESLATSFRRAYGRMCARRVRGEKETSPKAGGKKSGKASKSKGGKQAKSGKKGQSQGAVISSSSGKAPAATSSMKAHAAHHNALGLVLGATDELTLKADRAMIVVDCGAGDGVGLAGGGGGVASSSELVPPPPPPPASVRVPVLLCLVVLVLYVAGGGFLFHYLEGWTLMEGAYFCFTTLGTIGFGDLIPGRGRGVAGRGVRAEVISVVAASAYIMVGMALVAMTFALVQDEFVGLLRRLSRQCTTAQRQTQTPRGALRPSVSDSESNTEPVGASLSASRASRAGMAGRGSDGETLAMAVVSSS